MSTRLVLAAVAALATVAVAPSAAPAQAARSAAVVRVLDGDTVRVQTAGRVGTVDLVGVRAPVGSACFASEARTALRRLLPVGTRLRLVDEARIGGRGRYLLKGGTLVNAALLRTGGARIGGTSGFARGSALRAAARSAITARRGLHGRCRPSAPPPSPPPPGPGPGGAPGVDVAPDAARMRAALDGRAVTTVRTDTNSSDRADTRYCPGGRLQRSEEFTPRDAGAGPVVASFAGSWAIGHTVRGADGSLTAQVLLRADDPSIELRRLTLTLSPDGRLTQSGQGATDSSPTTAACTAPPAGSPFENDTAAARQRLTSALLGRRFDAPGVGITDVCPGPRLRRTEGGAVVTDGTLVVEWAISDGSTTVAIVRVEDAGRRSSRRLQVALPPGAPAELTEFGRGDPAVRAVTAGAAVC